MSYCVNCGVELDSSLNHCPLCNTPVINPNELKKIADAVPPFPEQRGEVDTVKRRDFTLLIGIILTATSASCLLLNLLVFTGSLWSLFIIGACLLLFIVLLPAITTLHLPMYLSLALDGAGIAFYLYLISFTTADQHWFFALAVPIVGLCTILCEIFAILMKHFRVSYLTTTLYFFVETALLCMGLELLIEHFLTKPMRLTWSAIVLTVCAVISITLLTILSRQRLREAVRRRLHF